MLKTISLETFYPHKRWYYITRWLEVEQDNNVDNRCLKMIFPKITNNPNKAAWKQIRLLTNFPSYR